MDMKVEPSLAKALKYQMEQLSTTFFDKICRACLSSEAEETAFIFEVAYENVSLWEIFKSCVALQIERNDNLPKNICKTCITSLVQIYTFKQQCQRSDDLLRAVVNEQNQIDSVQEEDVQESTILEEATVLDKVKFKDKIADNGIGIPRLRPRRNARSKRYKLKRKIQEDSDIKMEKIEDENIQDDDDIIIDRSCTTEALKNTVYACKYCNECFDSYGELKTHRLKVKHPRPRNYTCPECYKSFSYSHLQQHMRTHTKEKPFPCHICQMQFSLKCNLRRHMMIHTGERPHTCDICGKGFIQATTLVDHKRTHTGETPFICSYCGMSFGQSSRHKAHLRRHLIENGDSDKMNGCYECNVCQRQFTTRGILKTHLLTHGEKTFLCSQCGKGFVSNAGLLSHMKVHTGVKPYPCTICSKAFSQLGSLKSHMLIHTGQKPFICKVCSKAFTQRNHLKYHMRTHSGERPYVCAYCEKSFALKGTLTIHVRTHTGETPYICDVCGRGFYDSSSMKKHKRGHGQLEEKKILNQADAASHRQKIGS